MKIKLIAPARKPEWGENFWDLKTLCTLTGRKAAGAPLVLPVLAALTPPEHEVVLVDENVERLDVDDPIDLVGITGMTCVIQRGYEIADCYRARRVPVVMGGIHVSMLPDEALAHCDAVVIGEAEGVWETVVRDAQERNLRQRYRAEGFPDLSLAPSPRWDLMGHEAYAFFSVQVGRGCPHDCEFCSVQLFNGRQYRCRPVSSVIDEVSRLKRYAPSKPLFFVDDNILAWRQYAHELFRGLAPLGVKWWCQASVDGLRGDEETLRLMHAAGCREVFVGFESVSQEGLEAMHKSKDNRAAEYAQIIDRCHHNGIAVVGSFIFGGDADDEEAYAQTQRFIKATNMPYAMANVLTPPPGSRLFERLCREGRLTTREWWRYDGEHVCFQPLRISGDSLLDLRRRLLADLYDYGQLYRRLGAVWARGVFIRTGRQRRLFTRGRVIMTIKLLGSLCWVEVFFAFRCLWSRHIVSIMSVLMAISFHEYSRQQGKESDVRL